MTLSTMIKKYSTFKLFLLSLSILFFLPSSFAYSCFGNFFGFAGPGPEDDQISFLEPGAVGVTFFAQDYYFGLDPGTYMTAQDYEAHMSRRKDLYFRDMEDENQAEVDNGNREEWREYLKGRGIMAGDQEINDFINSKSNALLEKAGKKSDLADYRKFMVDLDPFLEKVSAPPDQTWHTQQTTPTEVDSSDRLDALVKTAMARYQDPRLDPFLRAKYGFQAVRMAVLRKNPEEALKDYEQAFGKSPIQSLTRYRALAYRAKAYLALEDTNKALRDYLDVIDQCVPLRAREIYSTRLAFTAKDFFNLARATSGRHHLSTLYYVLGLRDLHDYSAKTLEKIMAVGMKEPQTEAAFLRTVQTIEKNEMSGDRLSLLGLAPAEKKEAKTASGEKKPARYAPWISLCERALSDKETRQPPFWSMMGAYLALLEGDRPLAESFYKPIADIKTKNDTLNHQIHLVGSLLELPKENREISGGLQKRLVEDLQWAGVLQNSGQNPLLLHSLWALIAQKYLVLKDLPRAILSFCAAGGLDGLTSDGWNLSNFLVDAATEDADLAQLQKLIQKAPAWDGLLTASFRLNRDDLQLIRAVKAVQKEDYPSAQNLLKAIPPAYWQVSEKRGKKYHGEDSLIQEKKFAFLRDSPLVKKMKSSTRVLKNVFYPGGDTSAQPVTNTWNEKYFIEQETMGLVEYVDLMAKLAEAMETQKKAADPQWAATGYQIAAIMSQQALTGWPEIRKPNFGTEPEYKGKGFYKKLAGRYPLGIPGVTDGMKKASVAYGGTGFDYDLKAMELCRSIVKAGVNREVSARCEALMAVLSSDCIKKYDPKSSEAQKYLGILKKRFSSTAFYKDFVSWCDAYNLKPEDTNGTSLPRKFKKARRVTHFNAPPPTPSGAAAP